MKTPKRALSLLICLSLVMGFTVFPAFAAYNDATGGLVDSSATTSTSKEFAVGASGVGGVGFDLYYYEINTRVGLPSSTVTIGSVSGSTIHFTAADLDALSIGNHVVQMTDAGSNIGAPFTIVIYKPVNVTYDLNGGDGSIPAKETKMYNAAGLTLPGGTGITHPEGKLFKGWGSTGTATTVLSSPYIPEDGAVTLYAIWADPVTDVIVDSTTSDSATINLTKETVNLAGFNVAAYSLDGGKKWKKGALPPEAKLKKLFNKELTLWVADTYINKAVKADPEKNIEAVAKGVPDNARRVEFPTLEKRPKKNAEKLKPYYGNTHWVLAPKGATEAVYAGYEYALSSNGKTPNDGKWFSLDAQGIAITPGKVKSVYIFRSAPSSTTPASAPFKVTPANFGKPPAYKAKEIKDPDDATKKIKTIVLKKGDEIAYTKKPDALPDPDSWSAASAGDKLEIDKLKEEYSNLYIRKAATGKKPPSEAQKVDLSNVEIAEYVIVKAALGGAGTNARFSWSQSSAIGAITDTELGVGGLRLEVGKKVYIYAKWIEGGQWVSKSEEYTAAPGDVENGKTVTFSGGTAIPTITGATIDNDTGRSITVTLSSAYNNTSMTKESFVLNGASIDYISKPSSTTVTIFLPSAVATDAPLTINLSEANLPTYGSNNLKFTPMVSALTIITSGIGGS